jgi:hypothetical protein
VPIATYSAEEVHFIEKIEPQEEWKVRNAVLRRHVPLVLQDALHERTAR